MSWQRILELAREQGMPIIVTDIAGRDSMVVMPLERFEQLANRRSVASPERSVHIEIKSPQAKQPPPQDLSADQVNLANFVAPVEANAISELSLEEKFYLEPLDENQD
ncbi:hypothetical protein EXS71_01980 [Candidatus Uhrbacteria bacterium]|nr:hypothetical protein [Candidatus Uhrbacteria bacterium]